MNLVSPAAIVEFRHFHFFCGLGGGKKGFNKGTARVGNLRARFRCIGGIDSDPAAIRDFDRAGPGKGSVIDLFSREQYVAFHGREPPAGWRPAGVDDIRRAAGGERPHIIFLSAPCKGFSGLLPEKSSASAKYQALNGLTVRGVMLMLEAWRDDPPELIIFENVPRIMTRGRHLLDQIVALLRAAGYAVAETTHDCGEIGGLGQSRKRFLLVARYEAKVPPFLYEPEKRRLRGVGEILEQLPLPGDMRAGPMHRMPALQWKTWVRLAFVEAGADWRSLNKLAVEDGMLRDFAIMPDATPHNGAYGVHAWTDTAGVVTSNGRPASGAFSVADPRFAASGEYSQYGVRPWHEPTGAVINVKAPGQGAYSVADPRIDGHPKSVQLGVRRWEETAACVKGDVSVGTGPYAVSDPRIDGRPRFNNVFRIVPWGGSSPAVAGPGGPAGGLAVADPRPAPRDDYKQTKYRVTAMDEPAGTVIAASTTGNGAFAVADPRPGKATKDLQGNWHITPFDEPAHAVVGNRKSGASAVADPRTGYGPNSHRNKLKVVAFDEPAGTVTGSDRVGSGALSVADPRTGYGENAHQNLLAVTDWEKPSKTVTGARHVAGAALSVADPRIDERDRASTLGVRHWEQPSGVVAGESFPTNGAFSVADPRPVGLNASRENYQTGGHYGVVPWTATAGAVPAYAKYDRGRWAVADPRDAVEAPLFELPKPEDRLVAVIRALDGTWHRPFTTLELAALQSLVDPEEIGAGFSLDGQSDSAWRERIGNAVPPDAAEAIAGVMGTTLLLAMTGETFMLSNQPIWVRDIATAIAVDQRGNIPWEPA